MKFCKYCGGSIDDNAIFCSNCGARVSGDTPHNNTNPFDMYNTNTSTYAYDNGGSKLVAFVSFLCWEAGLIIWLLWRNSHPGKARSAVKGALASVSFGMPILGFILWLVLREDEMRRDYAKPCGIAALVGAGLSLLTFILALVLSFAGVIIPGSMEGLPFDQMAFALFGLLR